MRDRNAALADQGSPLASDTTTAEALRRVQEDTTLRRLLTIAAEDLTNYQPSREFDDADRIVLARQLADGPRQERQLLARVPQVASPTTRGEYALWVRKALGTGGIRG